MRRGEVYFVDFGKDKTTHKQCGIRPAVIVSNNRGNGHGPTVTVVPLTGNIHKRPEMPTHVQIPLSSCIGLKRPSMALAEQVDTVDKIKVKDKIGEIHDNLLMEQDVYKRQGVWDLVTYQIQRCSACSSVFRKTLSSGQGVFFHVILGWM